MNADFLAFVLGLTSAKRASASIASASDDAGGSWDADEERGGVESSSGRKGEEEGGGRVDKIRGKEANGEEEKDRMLMVAGSFMAKRCEYKVNVGRKGERRPKSRLSPNDIFPLDLLRTMSASRPPDESVKLLSSLPYH
jgi:hypothetical protein